MKKRAFTIKEVKPNIFLFNFKDPYECAMHFLRYQEYYESPNPKFRDHTWTILEYMKWYSKKYGNRAFTYPADWSGFNIPSNVIQDVFQNYIPDYNAYDQIMCEAWSECVKKAKDDRFYIIGATNGNIEVVQHEIAHGMFYINDDYKKEMTALVKQLKPKLRNACFKNLKDMGYTSKVFVDECQAYFATGLAERFTFKVSDKTLQPFQEVFKKYYDKE